MKILAFAASLRKASLNRKLITVVAQLARAAGADVDLADFAEFHMPPYDGDCEEAVGLPPGAQALEQRIEAADALIIAAPEYNYSISGALKNAIDWVSRARPMPWRGRSVYLCSASPSAVGGVRGLWQTRVPLEACGALVFPDMFALPNALGAFDSQGRIADASSLARLRTEVLGFVRLAEAVGPICCHATGGEAQTRQRQIVGALEDESQIQPEAH